MNGAIVSDVLVSNVVVRDAVVNDAVVSDVVVNDAAVNGAVVNDAVVNDAVCFAAGAGDGRVVGGRGRRGQRATAPGAARAQTLLQVRNPPGV